MYDSHFTMEVSQHFLLFSRFFLLYALRAKQKRDCLWSFKREPKGILPVINLSATIVNC